jgi:hypothetical protein
MAFASVLRVRGQDLCSLRIGPAKDLAADQVLPSRPRQPWDTREQQAHAAQSQTRE